MGKRRFINYKGIHLNNEIKKLENRNLNRINTLL